MAIRFDRVMVMPITLIRVPSIQRKILKADSCNMYVDTHL